MIDILNTREFKPGEIAISFRDANCMNKKIWPSNFHIQSKTWMPIWHIDQQLSRGNIVAISYKPAFLVKNPYELGKDAEGHASTIIAKREKGFVTQYLIRQSWPQSIEYVDQVELDPLLPGYIWVNASDLKPNLYEVIFIKD